MTGFVRRVVTGHDEHGKSIIVSDGYAPVVNRNRAVRADRRTTDIWNTTAMPVPLSALEPDPTLLDTAFIPPLGTRMRVNEVPPEPEAVRKLSLDQAREYFEAQIKQTPDGLPDRHGMMHRTRSLDYAIVLEGEVTMFLEQGQVVVQRGDVVIQRGTTHAWKNLQAQMARMLFIVIDGRFDTGLAALFAKPLPPATEQPRQWEKPTTGFIRRVVTGHDQNGKSVILADGMAPVVNRDRSAAATPGRRTTDLWNTTATPVPITALEPDPTLVAGKFVSPMGTRLRINEFPPEPEAVRKLSLDQARAHYEAHAISHPVPGRHGMMHRTLSLDYAVVLEGEMTCFLETGVAVLKAGDVLIQRGTTHAWKNLGNSPVRMLYVLHDARLDPRLEALLGPGH